MPWNRLLRRCRPPRRRRRNRHSLLNQVEVQHQVQHYQNINERHQGKLCTFPLHFGSRDYIGHQLMATNSLIIVYFKAWCPVCTTTAAIYCRYT